MTTRDEVGSRIREDSDLFLLRRHVHDRIRDQVYKFEIDAVTESSSCPRPSRRSRRRRAWIGAAPPCSPRARCREPGSPATLKARATRPVPMANSRAGAVADELGEQVHHRIRPPKAPPERRTWCRRPLRSPCPTRSIPLRKSAIGSRSRALGAIGQLARGVKQRADFGPIGSALAWDRPAQLKVSARSWDD